jgi:transposase
LGKVLVGEVPKPLFQILDKIKTRIETLQKSFGNLQKAGRPVFEDMVEVAVFWYVVDKLNIEQKALASFLGVTKNSVNNWIVAIRSGSIAIYDPRKGEARKVAVSLDNLNQIVESLLSESETKRYITRVLDSQIVQQFISDPEKIQKTSKHGRKYTEDKVSESIRWFGRIVEFINENRDKYPLPSNPDYWEDQMADKISEVISIICSRMHTDPNRVFCCAREAKLAIRRIKRFRSWFEGEIGAVVKCVEPKLSVLFTKHMIELRKIYEKSNNQEFRALYDIIMLHVWSGAREGYTSARLNLERKYRLGAITEEEYRNLKNYLDLDNEVVNSSLVGIKWEDAIVRDGEIVGFKIFEAKTMKKWTLDIPWIDWVDPAYRKRLMKIKEYAEKNNIKSVVKSILHFYGIRINSLEAFEKWYQNKVRALSRILDLDYKLNPHRLRASHISILAEFGVHLEYIVLDLGFGVGWEDLNTARIFYLRISEELKSRVLREAEARAKEIISKYI